MKSTKKKILLIILLIVIILIGGLLIWLNTSKDKEKSANTIQEATMEDEDEEEFVQVLEDGSKLNVSEELNKSKKLGDLEINNIQLREVNGITTLLAEITNSGNKTSEEKRIRVELLDKQGNVITKLIGVIDKIQAGESTKLNVGVTSDVANAYDFRISDI